MGSGDYGLMLAAKLAITAAFVVVAARAAERAGPLIGAMVATLPIAAGPAYVFLALDHDSRFIAASALASLAANAANMVFCTVYAAVAQSRGVAVSLGAALGAWIVLSVAARSVDWTLLEAVSLNVVVFAACLTISRRFRAAPMPPTIRRRYDVPLRAGMVSTLVAVVVVLSTRVGPTVTGLLALFPIVLISLILIFQPRIGGRATAALTANAVIGLGGFAAALVALHVAAMPLGVPVALMLALLVSIGCNLAVALARR
ncbi:MAG TPA: hypothetical protein VJS41_03220 [Stellaceae bacterium]|nr:hypothetical protein [Stellaceae bacterium]